ncbi:hypothetical protein GNI_079430 [Gregarina niphandrodes]|uniref:Uncharacterized protein n=1 Tax=Gregarina niphandrodes TaxID=110365 RepID=A0A023B6I2_GRENI|nr:hypothetical protein GNI_079430 [Gregarina niphandrodes]EZG66553.1 hypothetical protein GNI_079430 [Gregarina niphandrodes]|eukprot:XP_011130606.1 hypothetical protein GNI_079430 [Gregarina niphandrodes]
MSLDDFCVAVHRTICEEVSSISLDEHVEAAGPNQVGGADPPGGADKCLFIWRLCAVNMLKLRLNQLLSSECLKMPSTRPPSTEGTPIILLQDADGPEGAYRAGKAATLESSLSCIHLDRLEGAAGPNIHEHVVTPAALLQMVRIANTHLGVALSHFDAVSLPKGSIHQVLLVLELHRLRGNVVAVANFLAGCVPHLFSHPSIVRPHDIQDSLKDMWPTCWPTPGPAGGPKTVGECTSFIWGVIADIPHGSLVALNVLHQKYGRSDVWFAKMYDAIESIAGTRLRVPFTPESGATALRRAWVDAKIAACRKRLLRVAETTSVPGPWDLNLPSTAPARFATPSDENSRMRTRVHTHDPAAREAVTVFVDSPHIHAGKCNACGESLHLEGAYTAKHLGDLRWLELKRSLAALEIDSNGTTWHRDCHTLEVNWVSHCRNSPHSHNSADS